MYLDAPHVAVGLLAVGEHLPQRDAVAPHVGGVAEGAVVVGLRRVPLDGPLAALAGAVVRAVRRQRAGQTEVADLGLMSTRKIHLLVFFFLFRWLPFLDLTNYSNYSTNYL